MLAKQVQLQVFGFLKCYIILDRLGTSVACYKCIRIGPIQLQIDAAMITMPMDDYLGMEMNFKKKIPVIYYNWLCTVY